MTEDELERVFRRQVAAFNDGDLDGFVACYGEDAVLHGIGAGETIVGSDAIRSFYAQRLAEPGLHCEILETVTLGDDWLIARELVTSRGSETRVLAVFEICDGLIVRTTSLRS